PEKFEVPIIANLAGDEKEFVTELHHSFPVSLVKFSITVTDLFSKRLDMSVSIRHERNVKSFQGILIRVYPPH
ncbi:hypothetical protein ACERIM_19430, partial [Natrinema sp. H-ect1]|uniref:hypothetical protein n=1 Tax=Natrinema sp. H-ect1 TaxID=3242700 RepID=UPI00359EE428